MGWLEKLLQVKQLLEEYSETAEDALRKVADISYQIGDGAKQAADWIDRQQGGTSILAADAGAEFSRAESLVADCESLVAAKRSEVTIAGADPEALPPGAGLILAELLLAAAKMALERWQKRRQG